MLKKISIATIVLVGLGLMAFGRGLVDENLPKKNTYEAGTYKPVVVLELFTSQGCSSCPSADVLLDKVKKEYDNDVYALSYHVDYWNYIGWEDPFSKAKYTEKQREYNIKFRNRSNYTPQLVINGKEHFVGSSSSKVYDGIKAYKAQKSLNEIKLSDIVSNDKNVSFNFTLDGNIQHKNIRAVLVLNERTTSVERGENRNRMLKNSNIVVAEKIISLDAADGEGAIAIPEIVRPGEKISLIVLVANSDYDITAAAKQAL